MKAEWKIYFTVVGLVALMLVGYETNVWAKLTESESQVVKVDDPDSSSYLNSSKQPDQKQAPDGEFTVLNKNKDLNDAEVTKKEVKEDEGIVPTRIEIPSIDVDAEIENVGILENGEMGVPEDDSKVGWFEPGTKPGNEGNSVLAGHVDNYKGPAVFFYLKDLKKGDEITVTDKDGEKKTYVVQKLESYPMDNSPIEKIFGKTDKKRLNLITCTGDFIRDEGGHQDRLVVYTELKEPEKEKREIAAPTNVEVNGTFVTWHAVREDYVAGYRVYRSENGEDFEKVGSISAHERKAFSDPDAGKYTYYVTTVDNEGNESKPSEKTS
ncbi:class F sortase [Thalassobacillus hwangdonensis]|uniref:Sortase domain-bontaining protein n=1 Tax=Thalassobacillus hwangdonensis TaxID=546108 RepID=A0ABW3L8S8_9BACI